MLTVRSTINFASQTVPPIIPVVQGDPGRAILFTLADFTIPAGATATYYVQKPSGEAVYNNATIDGNNVLVNLTAQSIIEKGDNYGQVRIAVGEDVVTSFDFILLVKEFRGIDAVQSLTEMNIFDKAVEQAADAIDEVKTDAIEAIDDAKDEAIEEVTSNFDLKLDTSSTKGVQNQVITQAINTVNNAIGDLSGETVTPTATNNYGVGGNVGQAIETWATTEYWHGIYAVTAGNRYAIQTVSDYPQQIVVWFTNSSNVILEIHKAFATDHVEMVCTAPTGATKLFVMSYGYDAYHGTVQKVEPLSETVSNLKEDITSLENRVDAIEEADGLHRYGVSGIGQAAVALTRIWDSVGMTAQVGTDGNNSNVINNFDDVTPFNRRKCVGDFHIEDGRAVFHVNAYLGDENFAEDGTMGKFVAVECPRAFYYMNDGILGVSAHQYPGWKPFDIFCHKHNQNETIPYYYMPAYALAIDENGEAVSLPGYDNAQGDYKSLLDKARTYKGGELGKLAMLMPAAMNFYEWALYTVEFATQNCQRIMQGCAGLRQSNDDHCTFVDATHVLTNNYHAARVVGEYIAIVATNIDQNDYQYLATHKIVSVTRCDENGNASASGTHQLIELEDLGKDYYTYDMTGATEYRFVARPYRTGECNGVSTPSGSPVSNTDSYHPCKYRWHENPFSNQYKTTVDLFNERVGTADDNYYLKWYLLDDPTTFDSKNIGTADLETDAFVELDIETAHENYVSGYVKSKKYSDMYNGIWIPYETSGGSYNTYFCDYAYLVSSSLVRSVRFGGSWSNGSYDGFSYAHAHPAPSFASASYGGDLCLAQ